MAQIQINFLLYKKIILFKLRFCVVNSVLDKLYSSFTIKLVTNVKARQLHIILLR